MQTTSHTLEICNLLILHSLSCIVEVTLPGKRANFCIAVPRRALTTLQCKFAIGNLHSRFISEERTTRRKIDHGCTSTFCRSSDSFPLLLWPTAVPRL